MKLSSNRSRGLRRLVACGAGFTLLLAACGSDSGSEDGASPAEAAPADTSAVETTMAADVTEPAPVETDAMEEATDPVNLVFSAATPQVEKIPTIQAVAQLEQDGHETSITYLQSSEDPIAAVVRGDANVGSASASAVFAAIGQGIPVVAVMQANAPNYAMVAPSRR